MTVSTSILWMVVEPWLTVEPYPDWSLVTAISVHYEILRIAVFLTFISDSILPAGHSRQCFHKFSDRSVS